MKNKVVILSMILMVYANAAQMKTVSPTDLKRQLYNDYSNDVKRYKVRGLIKPLKRYCEEYLKGTYHEVNGCAYMAN